MHECLNPCTLIDKTVVLCIREVLDGAYMVPTILMWYHINMSCKMGRMMQISWQ